MKKLHKKIGLIALLITGISVIGFLYSCDKDEKNNDNQTVTQTATNSSPDKDYDAYVKNLMAKTGIDIYALSELGEVKKRADKNVKMVDRIDKQRSSTKICYTWEASDDEKLIKLEKLNIAIQAKYDAGDYNAVLVLYDSLCAIVRTIDGFIFNYNNEYGMQTFSFDPNQPEKNELSLVRMEATRVEATRLMTEVTAASPQFATLAQPVQAEVLGAAVAVRTLNDLTLNRLDNVGVVMTKALSVADQKPSAATIANCKNEALQDLAGELGLEVGLLTVGLVGCGKFVHPIPAGACVAVKFGLSALAGYRSVKGYYRNVRLCEVDGKY